MTQPAAIKATVLSLRDYPSRKVVQIILEAPIEHHAEIARVCKHEAWVAVARLQEASNEAAGNSAGSAKAGRPVPVEENRAPNPNPYAMKAALLGSEPLFGRFVEEKWRAFKIANKDDAAQFIRHFCQVDSRAKIRDSAHAIEQFEKIERAFYHWLPTVNQHASAT